MSIIRPCLDLAKNAWKHRHGDLDVYGTWYWDGDDRQWVPCLVITNAYSILNAERVQPCIVPIDHAWAWSEEKGGWKLVMPACVAFCEALRLPPDQKSIFRLVDLVRNHLEDLVKRIPPRPNYEDEVVVADAIVSIGGRSHHTEITDRV